MLIIMTHGDFAEGILNSARMILGEIPDVYTICIQPEMGPSQIKDEFLSIANQAKDGEHLTVMVDIVSGTPCNVSVQMSEQFENYTVLSGLNLAMLIQFIMNDDAPSQQIRAEDALTEARRQTINVLEAFRQR
ncbi:PTS sugar transporter subunit IIA [Clostridium sp. AM58-1XD]|uniref:PTS sugar transporter subunit IIA n=1 Tax=Clostridium sp. AM58-1XD TaxID=2292307 RepID=UPI0015F46A43|nr:PTS sugar transporter subunit IIA [Clostridium sp. AM58-1XD]